MGDIAGVQPWMLLRLRGSRGETLVDSSLQVAMDGRVLEKWN